MARLSRILFFIFISVSASCGDGSTGTISSEENRANASGEAKESERQKVSADEASDFWLGEPRNDLERFFGVYGDTDNPGRDFFVTEAKRPEYAEKAPEIPPGYMMIGAMWGDVAPWYMKSVSKTQFEQQVRGDFGPPEPIIVEFEIGENGNAVALTFETVFDSRGRLERLRDLPESW